VGCSTSNAAATRPVVEEPSVQPEYVDEAHRVRGSGRLQQCRQHVNATVAQPTIPARPVAIITRHPNVKPQRCPEVTESAVELHMRAVLLFSAFHRYERRRGILADLS
jgi:hypothetical protein